MSLTPEQVNEFIAKAVMDSQIGEVVKKSVDRVIGELNKSYNNPFDAVITQHVHQIIDEQLRVHYRPLLEQGIKDAMTKWASEEVFDKIISAATERLRSRY